MLPVATLAVVGMHLLEIVGVIRFATHTETAVLILPGPASHVRAFSCTLGCEMTCDHFISFIDTARLVHVNLSCEAI